MAYEEFEFHAIQNTSMQTFDERFRVFPSKTQRDRTYEFLVSNEGGGEHSKYEPVKLKVLVNSDQVEQLKFDLEAGTV